MQADLDELQLELGALRDRRRRRQFVALALRQDEEVVEVCVLLRLEVEPAAVNLKATTAEKLGFIGREEGMMAEAVVLLESLETS